MEALFQACGLYLYPVKACAGQAVERLSFAASGRLLGDREWVVGDADGAAVWQGSHPRLALVCPRLEGDALLLSASPGGGAQLRTGAAGTPCTLRMWNEVAARQEIFEGWDEGEPAADFLSILVGERLRLVRRVRLGQAALHRQGVNAVHLIALASLDALNRALGLPAPQALGVERLCPNIVLAAPTLPPFAEEQLDDLSWPQGRLAGLRPCVRCLVPSVDPHTGLFADQPLATLARLSAQRHPGGPVCFGMYLHPSGAMLLQAGTWLSGAWHW